MNREESKHRYERLVAAPDVSEARPDSFWTGLLAVMVSYGAIFLLFAADLYCFIFQNTYFRIYRIPRINRADYMRIDRHKLKQLGIIQKLNCVYCGYANGVVTYLKAVVNQMETYSCAIKHATPNLASDHQKDFFDYEEFA